MHYHLNRFDGWAGEFGNWRGLSEIEIHSTAHVVVVELTRCTALRDENLYSFLLHLIHLAKASHFQKITGRIHHKLQAKVVLGTGLQIWDRHLVHEKVWQDDALVHSLVGVGNRHVESVQPAHIVEVVQVEGDPGRVLLAVHTKLSIMCPPGSWVLVWAMIALNAVNVAAEWVALPLNPARVAIS